MLFCSVITKLRMIYLKMDLLDVLLRNEFANDIEPFLPSVLI